MPEGDTIFRAATVLRRVLAGQVVTGFEITAPKVSAAVRDDEIVGSTVKAIESNGKHLFIHFDTPHEVVLHTHMKMSGSWHVYRPDERWWQPEKEARVVIRTADVIRDDFDVDEALRRLREKQDRDIATALLDQSVISGIGNVFKVEALFLAKLSPWARVRDLSDDQLRAVVAQARKLIRLNRNGGERRTRFSLDPSDRMWVDERAGLPCHI